MGQGEARLESRDSAESGPAETAPDPGPGATGILPCQALEALVDSGAIAAPRAFVPGQIQPASLDLRLGATAHRVRASFLPGPERSVAETLGRFSLHEIDLSDGAVLEVGCVYVVELEERVTLEPGLAGRANPKSSIGRIDVLTRLIADKASEFDRVPPGYRGPLYAEIAPLTFGI
ncbi:MAG TPA: 2'-deoxycytidine 5'-triphosphate deaminase, partial [Kiloniellales bacterium]|nr:2'-deoxycytidine 5'-triphosphate deaminase [Kiloniellales bacterium]